MIYAIELGLVLAALVLAFTFPGWGSRWFEAVERTAGKVAERKRLAVVITGLTALAARAALFPVLPIPEPEVHDEFSHLLAADTFAHGRLTNPTHPMWIHFETFHVLWHPTYASMYPPAQGLIMAFGQAVLGHPFWGVWLSLGLMCATITWMLQGWLPPRWALLGGILAVIRLATFSYWANSYWGGAVAASGGALLFGALPRLKQSLRVLDALLLGLGLAVLANSRPYEGFVISLPVLGALIVWILGKGSPPFRVTFRRLLMPAGILMGIVAIFMSYYFWKVTGSPWQMPQQLNRKTYAVAPYFLLQPLRPIPTYHHAIMRDFYLNREVLVWKQTRSLGGLLKMECIRGIEIWTFYFLPLFTLPLVMALVTLPYGFSLRQVGHNTRFLLMATGAGVAGYALEVFSHPHYAAPGTCLVFALVLTAMRNTRGWRWREKPVGLAINRSIPVIAGLLFVLCASWNPSQRNWRPALWSWCSPGASNLMLGRAHILATLQQQPGRHLVIVRYSAAHQLHHEWVYNRADIDAAKVIWARDMGRQENAELLCYFRDRHIWVVEADASPPRLSSYPVD
jgi:hypothetical protein